MMGKTFRFSLLVLSRVMFRFLTSFHRVSTLLNP